MPVYHVSASANRISGLQSDWNSPDMEEVEIDFFVQAASALDAGAQAHDAFRQAGYEFGEYLALPRECADENDLPESLRAGFARATEEGVAMVVDTNPGSR